MAVSRRKWVFAAAIVLLPCGSGRMLAQARSGEVVVFPAASLKNALDAVNTQWQKETGKKATISYAPSPALAKQIEQAAPAQIFISADLDWMDYLARKNVIKPETRSNLLGNPIVLIATMGQGTIIASKLASISPSSSARAVYPWPTSIPSPPANTERRHSRSSAYAAASRASSRTPKTCAPHCCSSRGARRLPASPTKPTPCLIAMSKSSHEDAHPPIIYLVALTANATHPDAATFLAYVRSDKAKPTFAAQGSGVLGSGRS